jgi:hypothetical protein
MSKQEPREREDDDGAGKPDDLPSNEVTEGVERAPHRAMFRAMGYDDEDLSSPGRLSPTPSNSCRSASEWTGSSRSAAVTRTCRG